MKFAWPKTPSEYLLLLANLLPVAGVVWWGWKVFDIMALFWLENVVIGIFNILRMAVYGVRRGSFAPFFFIPFFSVHYGMFTLVHGAFIMAFFGELRKGDHILDTFASLSGIHGLWVAVAGLVLSHFFSFIAHFIVKGEVDRTTMHGLMTAPYTRIIVLHVTIILGAFVVAALGSPAAALVLLLVLKTAADLAAHRKTHEKLAEPATTAYDKPV